MPSNFVANGNLNPAVFCRIDKADSPQGSGGFKVVQASLGDDTIGVVQEGTNWAPVNAPELTVAAYAAVAGQNVKVFNQPGEECLLTLGAAAVPDDLLIPDSSGYGIPLSLTSSVPTTPQFYGARAKQGGSSGEKITVLIERGIYTYHS